jgi:hypothetical protein
VKPVLEIAMMFNRMGVLSLMAVTAFSVIEPTIADVGVTDACQDDIRELEEQIRDDKEDYTAESRRKAKSQLMAAKTNRLNPVKCRENILDARKELREGKRDKRKDD